MHVALLVLNLIVSAASGGFALYALAKPGSLSGSMRVDDGEEFYARMYAARSVPLAFLAGLLPFWYGGVPVSLVLLGAAVIQGADVIIAIARQNTGMVAGAGAGLAVHVLCAVETW